MTGLFLIRFLFGSTPIMVVYFVIIGVILGLMRFFSGK
jgi:hypothetical protein